MWMQNGRWQSWLQNKWKTSHFTGTKKFLYCFTTWHNHLTQNEFDFCGVSSKGLVFKTEIFFHQHSPISASKLIFKVEAYFGPPQTSMTELFCVNSQRLLVVNFFREKLNSNVWLGLNPFKPSDAFHIKTSHMIYRAKKKKTGFYMKCNTGLNWNRLNNPLHRLKYINSNVDIEGFYT